MRILHFADLHIGVENYSRPDPQTGLPSRVMDALCALDELVAYAIETEIDLVLFCGDAYKSREPSQTHQREFARRIRRLVEANIPVFLLIGNHDLPNAVSRATALEIFDTLGVANVYVAARPGLHTIPTRSGPVQVVAMPWPSRSWLLSREDYRNLTIEQVDRRMEELITNAITRHAQQLDPEMPAVLSAHVAMSLSLVKSGSERWMTVGHYPELMRSSLQPHHFDYVALGHHHVHQVLHKSPLMAYCGSLQRVDFGEEDDEKGFLVVTIDPSLSQGQRVTSLDFHPVTARRFVTISLEPKGDDPTPEVLWAIARAEVADAVVRVVLRLTPQQNSLLRKGEIDNALKDAHYVTGVRCDLIQDARRRLPSEVVSQSLTPMEALRLYLEARNVDPERRELLLQYAQGLVNQEGS